MKIKYIGKVPMSSKGITFEQDVDYDLAEDVVSYLIKTFPAKFEKAIVVKTKPVLKAAVKKKIPNKE